MGIFGTFTPQNAVKPYLKKKIRKKGRRKFELLLKFSIQYDEEFKKVGWLVVGIEADCFTRDLGFIGGVPSVGGLSKGS